MKKRNFLFKSFSLLLFILLFNNILAFAEDLGNAQINAGKFGFLTLLPPLIAIILAFITKNVVISLFTGVIIGAFLINFQGGNILTTLFQAFVMCIQEFLNSMGNTWNSGIILQCLTIGGLIALISKMGGTKAIAESLAKKAKTPRSAQIVTLTLGILVFFDDYANSLIVGPIMRPVTDKMKISREKLSFIIDATAAPIAGIAVISTWVGYELSLIKSGFEDIDIKVNAYNVFVSTIPYRFYNILILVFIFISAILLRDFGSMLKAERRARTTGEVLRPGSNPLSSNNEDDMEPKEGIKLSIWNAIIPIMVLIIGAFIGFYLSGYAAIMKGDNKEFIQILKNSPYSFRAIQTTFGQSDASIVLFGAALTASMVAMFMGVLQKIFTLNESIEIWVNGMKSLMITGVILILAWSLSSIIKQLGTATFLVSILSNSIPAFILPTIIFILSSIISFATGTSYGTMGILMPLTIPLAHALCPDSSFMIVAISSVLTGSIFGDHCSPISDTTILSSMGSGCDHIDHVKTQLYYALVVAGITIFFGYLPIGLGLSIYFVLPLAILVTFLVIRFLGKPVEPHNYSIESHEKTNSKDIVAFDE